MEDDLSINEPSGKELYQEGLKAYREKDYNSALSYFNEAIQMDPRYESALNAKGVVLHSLGRYSEAVTSFDLVLKINSMNEKARQNRDKSYNKITSTKTKPIAPPVQKEYCEDDYKRSYLLYAWLFAFILFAFGGFGLIFVYVLISAVILYIDSKNLYAGSENGNGFSLDLKPWEWALFTIFFWIISYPLYLYKRHDIYELNNFEQNGKYMPLERGTGIKIAGCLLILSIVCVSSAISVSMSNFYSSSISSAPVSTYQPPPPQQNNIPAAQSQSNGNIQFCIDYPNAWQGSLFLGDTSTSIEGTGPKCIPISSSVYVVSGGAQKKDGSSTQITVRIMKDGTVLKTASSTAAYGLANAADTI